MIEQIRWGVCADHALACKQQRGRRQIKQGIGGVQAYIRTQRREECRHTAASLWREIAGRPQHTQLMRHHETAHPASVKSSSTSKEEGGWACVTRARTHLALRPPSSINCERIRFVVTQIEGLLSMASYFLAIEYKNNSTYFPCHQGPHAPRTSSTCAPVLSLITQCRAMSCSGVIGARKV